SFVHAEGGTTSGIDTIQVLFSEELNNIDANALAAYDLRNSGANGIFGDGDDGVFTSVPNFVLGDSDVSLDILEGILPPGAYRLTVFSRLSRSAHDTAGLRLDGDGDGVEGGDYERFFSIAVNAKPTADGQTVTTLENTELPITLTGDDGDSNYVQNLTYLISSLPASGTLSLTSGGTPLSAGDLPQTLTGQTIYFSPALDSIDGQAFQFYVRDDGSTANGGQDTSDPATITINITPAPRVSLTVSPATITENGGTATVTATLSRTSTETVTVDLGLSGTAVGSDFNITNTQIAISPGDLTGSVTITAQDDSLFEGDETVTVEITSVANGVEDGDQRDTTTILDNESVRVAFEVVGSSAGEANGAHDVSVRLVAATGVTLAVPVTADVIDLANGSATSGADYAAFGTQTVTFAVGDGDSATRPVTLDVTTDLLLEGDETVNLSLASVGGPALIGAQPTHEVTIVDDEAVEVVFAAAGSSVDEANVGQAVQVRLVAAAGVTLAVPVTADVVDGGSGSATSGADYTAFGTQTVTFA
ncbi:MAG: Calx-beta domain-containing protein, partial [Pirellulales bacterium]